MAESVGLWLPVPDADSDARPVRVGALLEGVVRSEMERVGQGALDAEDD